MTTKSLQELSELCRSEKLAYKKCCNYVSETDNADLQCALGKLANGHRQRYESLRTYLDKN
ncbi:MAG: hypothetical protein J1G38_06190 [Clostridiales bacterium]|nr:hypothetical protein [Clostridiales bacterium]